MVTKTTGEAMALLNKHRRWLIDQGRYEAAMLAADRGTVHGRQVWEVMNKKGLLPEGVPEFWLGAIFRKKTVFKPTGHWVTPDGAPPADRNIHDWRPVREWELVEDCEIPAPPPPWRDDAPDYSILDAMEVMDQVNVLRSNEEQLYWQEMDFRDLRKGDVFEADDGKFMCVLKSPKESKEHAGAMELEALEVRL